MAGIVIFSSVHDALAAGYQICDKREAGFLARMKTARGWTMALVEIEGAPSGAQHEH